MLRPLAALLVLGGLVYVNALFGQFVWDDISLIVLNDHLRSWRNLPVLLTSDMFRYLGVHVSDYYRPLTVLTFFLDYQLWGLRSFGYHLTSVILHLVTGLLMYRVWARLSSPEAALLAALLWLVHPVHVQSVAYIASRGDILFTLWGLVALLLFLKERRGGSLLALAAALLSKETAVIVPAVLGMVGLARGWPRRRLVRYLALCGLVIVAYVFLRVALGMALTIEQGRVMGAQERGLLALKVIGVYAELLVWPRHLQFPRAVAIPQGIVDPAVLLSLALLAGGLVLVGWAWRRWPGVAIGICWFFLGLLPHTNLTLLNVRVNETWLYFPAVGFWGAAAIGVLAAERRLGKQAVAVVVGAAVALLSVRTVAGIVDWRDEFRVGVKAIRSNPESMMAWRYLGSVYAQRGNMAGATAAFDNALRIDPRDDLARRLLGQVFVAQGDYGEAEKHLRIAVELNRHGPWNHHVLGEVLYKQGRTAEAVAAWQQAIETDPLFRPARTRLKEVGDPPR